MADGDARARLAADQERLLRALVADGPAPDGFDPDVLAAQAFALRAKRWRAALAGSPPRLAERLLRHRDRWDRYALARPLTSATTHRRDARAFSLWLRTHR